MAKEIKFRPDGEPDGRGHAEGSKPTQFAPGDGRRRPGRPKGAKSLKTIYREVAEMTVVLERNGRKLKVSTVEGVILKQREKALKGDQRAAEKFLEKVAEHSPIDVEPGATGALLEADKVILASAHDRGLLGLGGAFGA